MSGTAFIGAGVVALFAAAAWLAIWTRRDTRGRVMAMALFLSGVPAVAAAMVESLGHHRPMWTAWDMTADEYLVLAAVLRQDEAIWVYLTGPDRAEPRPVMMPWSNELADAMQKAMDEAPEGREGQFILRMKPEDREETEITAHALPQPAQPPAKDEPAPGITYEQE